MAASEVKFQAFLKSINLDVEYFERFKETGFDDVDLVKSLEPEELQHMFDLVGLAAKPGHILKFKKAVAQLDTPTPQRNSNVSQSSVPQKKVQKIISFLDGKFVLGENAKAKDIEPWQKYTIPNVKSERLMYHNQLTKEIYLSAYSCKQSGFQSYLNCQRQFRWNMKCSLEKLQNIVSTYKSGLIPKENINCARYKEFPTDVKVEDVNKSQRAIQHINNTLCEIKKERDKLLNRKKELYGEDMVAKKWASNEIAFLQEKMQETDLLLKECEQISHDLEHVSNQLNKRFDSCTVHESEKKRKLKRAKEQRSKAKRKKQTVKMSKVIKQNINDCSSSDDTIDIFADDELL